MIGVLQLAEFIYEQPAFPESEVRAELLGNGIRMAAGSAGGK